VVPARNAVFVNAATGPTTAAVRPEGGQWDNGFQLASQENREVEFGANRFEIVLDAQSPGNRVQKVLDCGNTYVVFYDFPNNRWDIVREDQYK